jgi:hypothetical protein
MPPTAPQTRQTVAPDDFRIKQVERAVGAEYEVLGEICEIGEGGEGGIAFLAQRRSTTRLDVLRLVRTGTDVDVLGAIGQAFPLGDDLCPNCNAPIRAGVRFCGSCRANLVTLPLTGAADSLTIAEWLEVKAEAARNQYQLLGQIDEKSFPSVSASQLGVVPLVARMTSTAKATALVLERASAGNPAVLGLDQTGMLPKIVGALLERRSEKKKQVREAPPPLPPPPPQRNDQVYVPPVVATPEPVVTPVVPLPPPRFPLWAKATIMTTSGAALIAAVAWMVSVFSGKSGGPTTAVAADSIRADSLRTDSLNRERDRAENLRIARLADSATLQILSGPRGTMAVTVDRKPVTRSMIKVTPGRHILSAVARGYSRATDTLDIKPGERLTWAPRLEPLRQVTPQATPQATPDPVAVSKRTDTSCIDASTREDWAAARAACEKQAAAGANAVAERTLGTIYERGLSVPRDFSAAATWYAKSASHDDAGGQYRYGLLLRDGRGVARDEAKAFELFRTSATKGVADAQFAAGDALDRGAGVARNRTEAARWYQMAAEQGNADAQFALGNLYTKGDGVPKSESDAIKWYQKAAAQGHAKARRELSWRGIKS